VVDQGVEVRAGIRAEADHEVVVRPEGHRASVGHAATVEPNAEADLLQFSGERLVLSSMQAVLERRGFETYDRGLVLRKRRLVPNPRGTFLGRLDFEVTPSARTAIPSRRAKARGETASDHEAAGRERYYSLYQRDAQRRYIDKAYPRRRAV
jgi:hypothetical protein